MQISNDLPRFIHVAVCNLPATPGNTPDNAHGRKSYKLQTYVVCILSYARQHNYYLRKLCLSVCHTLVLYQTNEDTCEIAKNTRFLTPTMAGGNVPFHQQIAVKVTHLPLKSDDFDQYLLITS